MLCHYFLRQAKLCFPELSFLDQTQRCYVHTYTGVVIQCRVVHFNVTIQRHTIYIHTRTYMYVLLEALLKIHTNLPKREKNKCVICRLVNNAMQQQQQQTTTAPPMLHSHAGTVWRRWWWGFSTAHAWNAAGCFHTQSHATAAVQAWYVGRSVGRANL